MGEPRYAGFWRRFFAYLIDRAIIIFSVIAILIVFGLLVNFTMPWPQVSIFFTLALIVLSLVVYLGYDSYFLPGPDAATPGKKMLGLVVVDSTHKRPISLGKAMVRDVLGRNIIDRLTFHVGDLLIIFDSRKQALHDKIAGTYVVYRDSLGVGAQ